MIEQKRDNRIADESAAVSLAPDFNLDPPSCALLLDVAQEAVERGVVAHYVGAIEIDRFPPVVRQTRACFVTVFVSGKLRGCRGKLEAERPLVEDVWYNAYSSAFKDPRFDSVATDELDQLDLDISVLGPLEQLEVETEQDFLDRIQPGIDGLLIRLADADATLLPKVWEKIPDRREFVEQLKVKAGLPATFWSPEIRCFRYSTFSFGTR